MDFYIDIFGTATLRETQKDVHSSDRYVERRRRFSNRKTVSTMFINLDAPPH